jgi:glycosyltransferase involved in cell wall biosynthesis
MKILQASRSIEDSGGISKVAYRLALEWQRAGRDVTTLTSEVEPRCSQNLKQIQELFHHQQGKKSFFTYWKNYGWTKKFTKAVSKNYEKSKDTHVRIAHRDALKADIVVAHSCHHQAVQQKMLSGKGLWWLNPLHGYFLKQEKSLLTPGDFHYLVAISTKIAQEYQDHLRVPKEKIRIIPNGVDIEQFNPQKKLTSKKCLQAELGIKDVPLFLFAGHEFERKGLRYVLEAMGELKENHRSFHLLVIGKDDPTPFKIQCRKLGISSEVSFLGFRRDAAKIINAADSLVFPTDYEAFPLIAIEAMAAGTILLATEVSGIQDYLVPGKNGLAIVRSGEQIARQLQLLMDDRHKSQSLAAEGRRTALEYSWSRIAEQYLTLIDLVAEEKGLSR